jgi:hypothetical protein
LALAAEQPVRIRIVDAALSLDRVQQQIAAHVRSLTDGLGAQNR